MSIQYVSTEAVHSDGEAVWGVSHAPESIEVIMLSCRHPLRSSYLLVGLCGTALSHRTLLCCCINQAAGAECTADPGVLTSSNQTTETQHNIDCLSFKSLWRYGFGCFCFHFTPLEWT